MNMQSHLLLAMALEQHIKDKYGVQLRSDMFYYGNIRPDLTPRWMKKYPHTFQESLPMFLRQCRILMFHSRHMQPPMYILSYRLGVICHYTADFFTYAHCDPILFQKPGPHYRYENELYQALWKSKGQDPGLPSDVGLRLDEYLRLVMKQYRQKNPSDPIRDAGFIYHVALKVCDRMVERIYMQKQNRCKGFFSSGKDAQGILRERARTRRQARKVAYEWENYWPVNQSGFITNTLEQRAGYWPGRYGEND